MSLKKEIWFNFVVSTSNVLRSLDMKSYLLSLQMLINVWREVIAVTRMHIATIQLVDLIALATKAMREMVSTAQVGRGLSQ